MRIESSVTAVSWVPLDCVEGGQRLQFHVGAAQYDDPPPGHLDDLPGLLAAGRVRFANQLQASIEVDDGRIVAHRQSGQGHVGAANHPAGAAQVGFAAVALPDLRPDPEVGDGWVRFGQTAGGLLSVGMPYSQATNDPTRLAAPAARADVATPTITAERAPAARAWWRAKVSPMVCSTCTPGRSSPSIGGRTGTAPVPMTSWS